MRPNELKDYNRFFCCGASPCAATLLSAGHYQAWTNNADRAHNTWEKARTRNNTARHFLYRWFQYSFRDGPYRMMPYDDESSSRVFLPFCFALAVRDRFPD